jgi:hypothetical protein
MLVGLVHVALVWPHYFVGSFDDDSSYIMSARAIAAGHGLTYHVASGDIVTGSYPPGYPALLAPLIKLFPGTFLPLRLLSLVCFAALFPLTWIYLRRRQVNSWATLATLGVLALCPSLATFGSMVMAETPFLVLLIITLLLCERWEHANRVLGPIGLGTIVATAGLVWLKEAAIAVVPAIALWFLLQRQIKKAAAVLVGVGATLIPVLVARSVAGVPLAGTRYSVELGGYYSGGLAGRLGHVLPSALRTYFSTALPVTLVPRGSPLPQTGTWAEVLRILTWHVSIACVVGLVIWWRRHRDAAVVIVPVYAAETLLWPAINERRVILVLPLLAVWYVLGMTAIAAAAVNWLHRRRGVNQQRLLVVVLVVTVLVIGVPIASQFGRDYLYADGQTSSRPQGSRYLALLSATPDRHTIIETDYLSTTALFSGHPTADGAFLANLFTCGTTDATTASLATDSAGYLLLGALNKPFLIDNYCLMTQATAASWAVPLLQTPEDLATVFELIGPGTAHPSLVNETAGIQPVQTPIDGGASLTWSWSQAHPITQVAASEIGATAGCTGVEVDLLTPSGTWQRVTTSNLGIGDGKTNKPYLLVTLPTAVTATALRITVHGQGQITSSDLSALGPAS